jgi:hypothetical protein
LYPALAAGAIAPVDSPRGARGNEPPATGNEVSGVLVQGGKMARDSRYDVLFEPVKIGPVTSRNRFFQVPHCNGMRTQYPRSQAAMRATKGEGGWGVVCTEECLFHMTSDLAPYAAAMLYDDGDIPPMALIACSRLA